MKIVTKSVVLMTGAVIVSAGLTAGFALSSMRAEIHRQASAVQESRLKTSWQLLKAKGTDVSAADARRTAERRVQEAGAR